MKEPMFRLIHRLGLSPAEVKAACSAINRFRGYGVTCDAIAMGESAVRKVKMGRQFLETLGPDGPVRINSANFLMPRLGTEFADVMQQTSPIIGIGLTYEPILLSVHGPRDQAEQKVIGAGRYRGGAFVTVSGLREFFGFRPDTGEYAMHQKSAIDAVELAVCHEVGHVLIESYGRSMENLREEWHCNHPQCLMQETSDIAHFVEHAVKARLNFCKECARRIRMEVETLRRDSEEYD